MYRLDITTYVDSHSIFRFVQGRDSFWRNHYQLTDEANPQWKQVLDDCRIKVTYALSHRPRERLKDPTGGFRTCYRENVKDIKKGQLILNNLLQRYNYRIVHSTTREIPYIRF